MRIMIVLPVKLARGRVHSPQPLSKLNSCPSVKAFYEVHPNRQNLCAIRPHRRLGDPAKHVRFVPLNRLLTEEEHDSLGLINVAEHK